MDEDENLKAFEGNYDLSIKTKFYTVTVAVNCLFWLTDLAALVTGLHRLSLSGNELAEVVHASQLDVLEATTVYEDFSD